MTGKRAYRIVAAIAVLALLAGACSSGSDVVADNVAEQMIEAGVEGDVDVDVSGDGEDMSINIDSEDGDVSIEVSGEDEEMTIEMESDEGTVSIGVGTELPEELDIPVPDGGDVMTSFVADDGVSVALSYDVDRFDELTGFYEDWTSSSGDEWTSNSMSVDSDDGTQRMEMWTASGTGTMIMVTDCADGTGDGSSSESNAACVTINQVK
jgi:hypothetical protein